MKVYGSADRLNESSFFIVRPSEEPGAVAEVVFKNEEVNNFQVDEFSLAIGTLDVQIRLDVHLAPNAPDTVTVIPPDGYIAIPEQMTVDEGSTGIITIYSMETPSS